MKFSTSSFPSSSSPSFFSVLVSWIRWTNDEIFVSAWRKQIRNVHGMNKHITTNTTHTHDTLALIRNQPKIEKKEKMRIHRHSPLSGRLPAQVILWMILACVLAETKMGRKIWLTIRRRLYYAHKHIHSNKFWLLSHSAYNTIPAAVEFIFFVTKFHILCGWRVCGWTTCIVHSFNFLTVWPSINNEWLRRSDWLGASTTRTDHIKEIKIRNESIYWWLWHARKRQTVLQSLLFLAGNFIHFERVFHALATPRTHTHRTHSFVYDI